MKTDEHDEQHEQIIKEQDNVADLLARYEQDQIALLKRVEELEGKVEKLSIRDIFGVNRG
jgi:U3 small nucleolar ribonucleoprotein component